jgi:hypothetical protein
MHRLIDPPTGFQVINPLTIYLCCDLLCDQAWYD